MSRRSILLVLLLVLTFSMPAAQRASADDVEQRIAAFWARVGALGPSDLLTAADLGQWALNVTQRDPGAGITVADFRASTAAMQQAFDRAGVGVPPGTPKSTDVEARIALFWQKLDALGPSDVVTAADLGQWALNVTDRDPNKRIRVDDFRASTSGMQAGLDRARSLPRPPTATWTFVVAIDGGCTGSVQSAGAPAQVTMAAPNGCGTRVVPLPLETAPQPLTLTNSGDPQSGLIGVKWAGTLQCRDFRAGTAGAILQDPQNYRGAIQCTVAPAPGEHWFIVTFNPSTTPTVPPVPAAPVPGTLPPTPAVSLGALSLVLNSVQCGPHIPGYPPGSYLIQGFVANLTATGPVGAFITDIDLSNLTVLDWTGTNPGELGERLSADPPATRLVAQYSRPWSGQMDWTPITLSPPGLIGYLQQTFHISCP